ncbi:hypothetical protein B9T26_01165 [Acinetobacter sp. ANC 4169]|uniref:fatty acid desaturase family protein n=1 Tax=Acinetobacter sp. ANC 4169 TaxID=1977879 RepID=UPI000A349BA8|nr:fatty acid desaturase [Acinetobacter sp. ANC 4169]OTG77220.1 hypothetical protein B9T26_01165 [Acinetobacter sp. ANC 4169]
MQENSRNILELPTVREIRTQLKPLMPEKAFESNPSQLLPLTLHLLVVIISISALRFNDSMIILLIIAVLAGNSIFCIGNLCHYLGHGLIVRNKNWRYFTEYVFFATSLTPATVFKVVHNKYHHAYTNGDQDTFRCFAEKERTTIRTILRLIFFPNKNIPWNPLVLISYNLVLMNQIMGAMFGIGRNGNVVMPVIPTYTPRQRAMVWAEMLGVCAFLFILYWLGGADTSAVIGITLSYLVAASISCFYIYTQHDTEELSNDNHPLINSVSLNPNRFFDWLHHNVGYHVEHHLFPNMNYRYAKALSALLHQHYPHYYKVRLRLEIWQQLFCNDIYKPNPEQSAAPLYPDLDEKSS